MRVWPFIERARELLPTGVDKHAVYRALQAVGIGDDPVTMRYAWNVYKCSFTADLILQLPADDSRRLGLHQHTPTRAPAGTPGFLGTDYFRSQWEERTAKALTRLGIAWTYEAERFAWMDRAGHYRYYTPDFRLDGLTNTFVEVKGWAGAEADDAIKMDRVLRRYPKLTLMLWDADTVEFVEDNSDPTVIISLLRTTTLVPAA